MGKRLAPYTFVIPKPIMPIGTTPILEVVLRQLSHYGFREVTIALGHMSDIIRAVAGDGEKFGVRITYSQEPRPLGTIGPLALLDNLSENFIVMNADLLTDLDFRDLWNQHTAGGAIATVATFEKITKLELGVIRSDEQSRIVSFEEKPTLRHKVSMGIYVLNRAVLGYIPTDAPFGFDGLMETLLARGETVCSYEFGGRWLDIGVPADYDKAQEEFDSNRGRYLPHDDGPAA